MRTSIITAIILVAALAVWMASGMLGRSGDNTQDGSSADASVGDNSATEAETGSELMKVQVAKANLESRPREIVLQGQLEPARVLAIRAEITSTVQTLPASKGQRVKAADVIATLAMNGRDVDLAEADAQVRSAVSEQQAAAQLRQQGLQSKVQSERASAALAAAQAQRNRIRRDIDNTTISAPFGGIINAMPVELGELVSPGSVVAELVDDSSFKVSAQVSQQAVAELSVGQIIRVELITGQELEGEISFVSSVANSQTRSFTVEAEVKNPGEKVAAGVSASLKIPVETLETVFLTPSALSLGDKGELGVKLVDENNQVLFTPVNLLSTTIDGAWVSGIPNDSLIITLGQAFVAVGETVEPIMETDESDTSGN